MSDLYLAASRTGAPPPNGTVSLCFTWAAFERLQRAGLSPASWEDLVSAADVDALIEWTGLLADNWHRDDAGDITEFEGYSLAQLYRWFLWIITLRPAYKFLTAIARAVELHRPEVVHCEDAVPRLYRDVLACAAKPLGFRVIAVASEAGPADSHDWKLSTLGNSFAKRLTGRVLNAAASLRPRRGPEWLISQYPSLESIAAAARRRGAAVAFADFPSSKRLPEFFGKVSVWLEPGLPPRLSPENASTLDAMTARWDRLRSSPTYAARFEWEGVSLSPVLEPILDEFVRRESRPWAWAYRQLERRWSQKAPAVVLLPYPGPPYQQALEQVARRHGTPVAVLLHGLPGSYADRFEHPYNGYLLVWGPGQELHYAKNLARTGCRALSVGNPYFDRYAGRRRARIGPIRRVVLLTNPAVPRYSDIDAARYIRSAAEVLAQFPELEVSIRLHPSDSIDYYRDLIAAIIPRAKIVKGGPVDACLEENDLLIGSFSTVLMEGILLGLPVATLNFSPEGYPPPFDGNWGVPQLRSADEFAALLREARKDPAAFRKTVCARHDEIISRFAGPVDGNASVRAVEALEALANRTPFAPQNPL